MDRYLVNEQFDVEDPDIRRQFGKEKDREDYPDTWKDTGNVILIGLAGSGKAALADLLAERTGLKICAPANREQAVKALKSSRQIVVLADDLVEDHVVQPYIHEAGKVFYFMADSRTLSSRVAERDNVEDKDRLWHEMSTRLAFMEPTFYSVLHFIVQAKLAPEKVLDDTLQKIEL